MGAGFLPLGFSMATSRRWLRVILALIACAYLSSCVAASLFVSDGMRAHGEGLSGFRVMLAAAYAISALIAFAMVFIPTTLPPDRSKKFIGDRDDLEPPN